MDSEMTFFLQEAETPESVWIPNSGSSFEGRLQAQAKGDQNKGDNYGENFGQSAGKKRRLTADQVQLLERNFNVGNKLEHERKVQLAKEVSLQPRQVAVWFQNRRARSKTKKMENDYDSLSTQYDKLKKDHDNLVEENLKLKAEVDELRGKKKMKNPFEPVETVDSSVTELGKSNTSTIGENLCNVQMGSCRQDESSRSSSKSDAFYSESPAMENQSQAYFFRDEEDDFGNFGKLDDGSSVDELMDSYNITAAVEDQPFCFWSY